MSSNPHFAAASSWEAAESMLTFKPRVPTHTAGLALQTLRIHVLDHKKRDVAPAARTLEAHYGSFVVSQSRKGVAEARRLALGGSYGRSPRDGRIAGHEARIYDHGPEPPPDDIDGRAPAVVTWHDAGMFYLIATGELPLETLVTIAHSMYEQRGEHAHA